MFNATIQSVIDRVDHLREEVDDHWQIPRAEATLLAQLVRIGRCRSVCEIGVSYGFSTLHLAGATADFGGHLHGVDSSEKKIDAAGRHLRQAGLGGDRAHGGGRSQGGARRGGTATLHLGDAREVVPTLEPEEPFDFVFIDAVKTQSPAYLEAVTPKLAPRAVLVTDNTGTHPDELAPFVEQLRNLAGASSCSVEVGNGFELTVWHRS